MKDKHHKFFGILEILKNIEIVLLTLCGLMIKTVKKKTRKPQSKYVNHLNDSGVLVTGLSFK